MAEQSKSDSTNAKSPYVFVHVLMIVTKIHKVSVSQMLIYGKYM